MISKKPGRICKQVFFAAQFYRIDINSGHIIQSHANGFTIMTVFLNWISMVPLIMQLITFALATTLYRLNFPDSDDCWQG
jgi:hypothetical protein